jgi:hypothetical protein
MVDHGNSVLGRIAISAIIVPIEVKPVFLDGVNSLKKKSHLLLNLDILIWAEIKKNSDRFNIDYTSTRWISF